MAPPEPWTNLRSPSTTSSADDGKIKRPRRAPHKTRRVAPPHRLAGTNGARTPVTVTLQLRQGSELWVEVSTPEGRFFVRHDASLVDLIQTLIRGGYTIEEHTAQTGLTHRRGVSDLNPS